MSDFSGGFLKARLSSQAVTSSLVLITSLLFSISGLAGGQRFPLGPEHSMTPGSVCTKPTDYRYPEHIPYCDRNVKSETKAKIFKDYDAKLGYETTQMDRADFKIDHYIPLCMGGSNEVSNLWPQHKSVYVQTDMLEQTACEKMAKGLLKQADAIELIREAKNNLQSAEDVLKRVQSIE